MWIFAVVLLSVAANDLAVGQTESTDSTAARTGRGGSDSCVAPTASLALDHVIVAVEDLEPAVASYRKTGFTIKPGRPHQNGLFNAHIKFFEGTQLELMSVPGPPTDVIARGYHEFLRDGEGGAFVAFRASDDNVLQVSRRAGVRADSLGSAYVIFPDLPRIFVLRPGRSRITDPDSILTHANGAVGIAEAWLEADEGLADLLLALGARDCGPTKPPRVAGTAARGRAFAVANGRVVLLQTADARRPLVRGVVLRTSGAVPSAAVSADRAHGVWIGFVSP